MKTYYIQKAFKKGKSKKLTWVDVSSHVAFNMFDKPYRAQRANHILNKLEAPGYVRIIRDEHVCWRAFNPVGERIVVK